MKCIEIIRQDHVILRRALDILERMVQIMEDGDRIEILDIRTLLTFLRVFGDEYHQTKEEKVLFPALLRGAPPEGALHQMLVEHGEERQLVAMIQTALNPKHGIGFVRSSRHLIQLLRDHVDHEDAILGAIAERLLSNEEDEWIVAEFTANQTHAQTYENFGRLERKYARKPRGTPAELARTAHT